MWQRVVKPRNHFQLETTLLNARDVIDVLSQVARIAQKY
ncbi:hypothetical protein AM1_G0087 (plasmid) [Acaryochloris marina MBIC11017]|uniref:Uncharacterized protein n=1 Tax=Acaryochloris marina (strain MBIC 11017) TaxID=329726 RepID=A8ZQI2_ACAM1|nr:hypothetical protein AM1_G0087 [Acaryochloris marina MBIC11017]